MECIEKCSNLSKNPSRVTILMSRYTTYKVPIQCKLLSTPHCLWLCVIIFKLNLLGLIIIVNEYTWLFSSLLSEKAAPKYMGRTLTCIHSTRVHHKVQFSHFLFNILKDKLVSVLENL